MSSLISGIWREVPPEESRDPDVMGQRGHSPAADAAGGRRLLRGWPQARRMHGRHLSNG